MRIAYVATDEVNQALAARMTAKCGAIICHLRPAEVLPDGGSFCRPDDLMVTGDRRSEGPGPQGPDRGVRGIHLIGSD